MFTVLQHDKPLLDFTQFT